MTANILRHRVRALLLHLAVVVIAAVSIRSHAGIDEADAAYRDGDLATAFEEFSRAARMDYPYAQNVLGTMYAQGKGVKQDYKLALDWFFKAQALGSAEAMANLARMHARGLGVRRNEALALKYYREAAMVGFPPAIVRMAEIHRDGEYGVVADAAVADAWLAHLDVDAAEETPTKAVPPTRAGVARSAPAEKTPAAARPRVARAARAAVPAVSKPGIVPAPVVAAAPTQVPVAAPARSPDDSQLRFRQQVMQQLEAYQTRERKLFVASTHKSPALSGYLGKLRTRLAQHVDHLLPELDRKAIVTLTVLADGRLNAIELNRGSGNARTDQRVLQELNKLASLDALPQETRANFDALVVTVSLPVD